MIIFANINSNSKIISDQQILTRWTYDYKERSKKGIIYNFAFHQFETNFYFKLMLKQTIEIENAPSLLLQDLCKILQNHGFIISGQSIINNDQPLLVKHDKKEDYIKIIQADLITSDVLDKHTYTPHEYKKYLIQNTFDTQLVNNDKIIQFVKDVNDIIPNHNNYMILNKYGVDDALFLLDDNVP